MIRKLDDTRVGEYKVAWGWNFIYTIFIVIGIVALFLFPIIMNHTVSDDSKLAIIEYIGKGISPVNYLIDNQTDNMYGYCSIAYIAFFSVLFINLFMCLSVRKLGKGSYSKVSKIIEFILGIICVLLHTATLFNNENIEKNTFQYFIFWVALTLTISFLSLIIYFNIKKISIYD